MQTGGGRTYEEEALGVGNSRLEKGFGGQEREGQIFPF